MVTKPRIIRHLLYAIHITNTQTTPYRLQNPARLLLPCVKITHPYYIKKCLPPIIHNIPIINLHASAQHPVKTHQNSYPPQDKHIFVAPCLREANSNPSTSPIQGEGILILNEKKSPEHPPLSSSNTTQPPLKHPISLLKNLVHEKKCTQSNTLPLDLLHTIETRN